MSKICWLLIGAPLAFVACGSPPEGAADVGSGGLASGGLTGGGPSTGGAVGAGGVGGGPVSGGAPGSGGASGSGGATAIGGSLGTGGEVSGVGGAANIYALACSRCHGDSAEGTEDGPPVVRATIEMTMYLVRSGDANETLNQMGQVVGHPKEMDAFSTSMLSDADIVDLVAWLQAFPKPTTGAELFAENCAFCHGADGKGGDTEYASAFHSAPFSRQDLAGFTTVVRSGHTSENGNPIGPSERREYMPPFADVLTDEDIALIYTWASAQ